jgi:hypothetical protein
MMIGLLHLCFCKIQADKVFGRKQGGRLFYYAEKDKPLPEILFL